MSENKKVEVVEDQGQSIQMTDIQLPSESGLIGQMLANLRKSEDAKAVSLAFEMDPLRMGSFGAVYKRKSNLVPNAVLKRIRDTEELVGGVILPLRAKQVSLFGRPRPNRFDIGFEINVRPEIFDKYEDEQIDQIKEDIVPKLRELLLNCGYNNGLKDREKLTFSQYLHMITEDMLLYGWWATEIIYDVAGNFHSFRARDAGTMYYALPSKEDDHDGEMESIRQRARLALEEINGHKIDIDRFCDGEYTWVQTIEETPNQVFTDDQLVMWSLNPSTDIMRNGYPVSPIERVAAAITTHINLTTANKLFFLNGRMAKSIMVFKSKNMDHDSIAAIRAQMTAHINSAGAAHRMPVFRVEPTDEVNVMPLDSGGRDMEFTYLADLNKRMIFAAFQLSPDEVASLSYLSRGTNSQAMSEANNEWKLLKSQESGIRPLLSNVEAFLNERLLPKINPEWSKLVYINLSGLDADSPEKEATLLQQGSALYMTMNDIMDRVEKKRVPIGGDLPMNAAFLQILEKYYTMGELLSAFEPERYKDAAKDPKFQFYINNPAWFQFQQMQLQQQQMAQQQQMQQLQAQQQAQAVPGQQPQEAPPQEEQEPNLDSSIAQLQQMLGKSEAVQQNKNQMLKIHDKVKNKIISDFEKNSKEQFDKIMSAFTGKKDNK
jgi:hypothetical protein